MQLTSIYSGVTIGIPLYNEEEFIEAAVLSAVHQCEELIISDNCSTDGSYAICEELAEKYPNIRLVPQSKNYGAFFNFHYVLEKAKTPFFMWLGAHDLLPEGAVKKSKSILDTDLTASLAYGATNHIDRNGNFVSRYEYFFADQLADDRPTIRLLAVIKYLGDCSLIHGLFRTEKLRSAWTNFSYLSGDHTLLARAVVSGKFLCSSDVLLIRRNPHLQDSPEAQLERINGLKPGKGIGISRQEMQLAQYDLAVQQSRHFGWLAFCFRVHARYWLVLRFGPFGKSWLARNIDKAFYQFARVVNLYNKSRRYFSINQNISHH